MPTSWQRSLRRGAGVTGRPGRPCRNARLGLGKASLLCCAVLFWAEASLSGPTGQAGQADRAGLVLGPSLDFQHLSGDQEKRYILETTGSGVALFDYDGDGDLDIYLVNASTLDRLAAGTPGEPNRLFRNEGGSAYVDVTELAGVGDRGFGQGVAAADFDNDGDLDLYVTNYGPNILYRNNGDGTFSPALEQLWDPGWGASAAWGDIDGDGFLDLYVCNYLEFDRELLDKVIPRQFCLWKGLTVSCGPQGFGFQSGVLYRNRGDGTFQDWTDEAGLVHGGTYQLGAVFFDLDLDGDQDLYVASDSTLNLLFENLGAGRFRDVSLISGAGLSQFGSEQAGMGVDAGDVNGDGRVDLFVTNFSNDYNTLYLNRGEHSFVDSTDAAGLALASLSYLGWSTRLADLDADGDLDIFLVNGHVYPQVDGSDVGESFRQPMQLFLNRGDGTFEDGSSGFDAELREPQPARGAALGDLDGDLLQDAVVQIMDGTPLLVMNRLASSARIVVLELVGRAANRDGVGAVVWARVGERIMVREVRGDRGYLSRSDSRLYLGLGSADKIDELTVQWPGEGREVLRDLGAGSYTVVEGVGIVAKKD